MAAAYDSFHMGRCSIDLYSDDIGAPFADITRFSAYVGGSPTNISVGARRLGLQSALLTAVGDDPVGEFILSFLRKEGVGTDHIPVKEDRRTPAVLLGIEPPDRFPLVYYRENCADGELSIEDVPVSEISAAHVFQFAGTNLSLEPSRSATVFAAEGCTTCRSHRGFRSGSKGEPMARHSVLWGGRAGYDASRGCGGWDS